MKRRTILLCAVLVAGMNAAQAFDMGDMMNPGKWFGGDHDRDYYDRGGYWGGYGPYGWGGGPYGWGGGPYGWGGGPWGGWGGPYGYGYGGYPGAIVVNPSQGSSTPPPPRIPE